MNPEQRLLVIQKYLAIEFQIFFICTVIWMLGPEWMRITDGNRTLLDLRLFLCRRYFYDFFLTVLVLFFFCLGVFMNIFHYFVRIQYFFFQNCLVLWFCICIGQENLGRHEGAILLQHLTCTIFIGKLQTFFIQKQGNLSTDCSTVTSLHLIACTTITFPVYRFCTFLIRQSINMYFICYHKCGIESQSKMTDDLISIGIIFIFFNKICST